MRMRYVKVVLISTLLSAGLYAQSPIDWWRFDETGGGIASNEIGGRADGELTPGASFVGGASGNAVSLPPFESVTFWGDTGNLGTSDFTIMFWLKTNGSGTLSAFAEVLGNRGWDGSCDTPYIDFRMGSTGRLALEINDWGCSGYLPIASNEAFGVVNDGAWHRIVAVRTGATASLYIDGDLRGTGTAGDGHVANVLSLFPFVAGANDDAFIYNVPFDGVIDDLRIYDQAFSANQVVSSQLAAIIALIQSYDINAGIANSLVHKLQAAEKSIDNGNATAAVNQLQAFLKEVSAQNDKNLSVEQAGQLTSLVKAVISALT